MIRSVRRRPEKGSSVDTSTSTTGLVIRRVPRYSSSLPKNSASVPTASCFTRQGWLKKVAVISPVASETAASTRARPLRVRRPWIRSTVASTTACSPRARSARSACRRRSM